MVDKSVAGPARAQAVVFVGGPRGVGKTAACKLLYRRLPNSIYVDADDLWCQMNPFRVNSATVTMGCSSCDADVACRLGWWASCVW